MSTYMEELKKRNPEAYRHRVIAGCHPGTVEFRNMVRALKSMPILNTAEDNARLESASWLQRNKKCL